MKNVLFICSQNKLRSPTAENIFSHDESLSVRSAGLNNGAVYQLTPEDVEWADYIFLMENSHREKLLKYFKQSIKNQKIIVLDIPDRYEYMDEDLIRILKNKVPRYLN